MDFSDLSVKMGEISLPFFEVVEGKSKIRNENKISIFSKMMRELKLRTAK